MRSIAAAGARALVLTIGAVSATAQRPPDAVRASALQWVAAALAHQPGTADAALWDVSGWSTGEFESVLTGLASALAQTTEDPERHNNILRRGVLLHTDIAILAPERAATFTRMPDLKPRILGFSDRARVPPLASSNSVVMGSDGRYVGYAEMTAHWELARMLVERLRRNPPEDAFVVRWYRATTAHFELDYQLGYAAPHLERARRLLPRDPWILFYSGALHEALASPRYQNIQRSGPLPKGQSRALDSPREELGRAADYFQNATRVDPAFAEAHLRHGRVLGLLGRHSLALEELRRALALTDDPVQHYYGNLLAAGELESLEQREEAQHAYERCIELFPTAQAPLVGLSELARRYGDRAAALDALQRLAALTDGPDDRTEPWWNYLRQYAWNADRLLEDVRRPFVRGGAR